MQLREEDRFPNCDTEEIQFLGQIQNQGTLVMADAGEERIQFVSENSADLLAKSPAELLGTPLSSCVSGDVLTALRSHPAGAPLFLSRLPENPKLCATLLRDEDWMLVEMEPVVDSPLPATHLSALPRLMRCGTEQELMEELVQAAHRILQLDRVLLYRFQPDFSGVVTAEINQSPEPDYLHLRFPAGDIPPNARKLYLENPLRIIFDVEGDTAEVVSEQEGHRPDLSHSLLRAVAPVHRQYLRNMGVKSALSLPIVRQGGLYALLSAHHGEPLRLSMEQRMEMRKLLESFQMKLRELTTSARMQFMDFRSNQIQHISTRLHDALVTGHLSEVETEMLEMTGAQGLILHFRNQWHLLGSCPEEAFTALLVQHIPRPNAFGTYVTDCGAALDPAFTSYTEHASGILAAWTRSPSPERMEESIMLFWIRPEQIREVDWGGKPPDDSREVKLAPRRSFQKWSEIMDQHSSPWERESTFAASAFLLAWQNLAADS